MKITLAFIVWLFPLHSLISQNGAPAFIDSLSLAKGEEWHGLANEAYENNIDSAIYFIRQAVPYFKKSGDQERYIVELLSLSVVLHHAGKFSRFQENAIFTLSEAKSMLGEKHPYYAGALNNLNTFYYDIGDFQKAIQMLKESLLIYQDSGQNRDTEGFATTLNNLANNLTWSGDYEEALEVLEQVRIIREKESQKDLIKLIMVYNAMAWNMD